METRPSHWKGPSYFTVGLRKLLNAKSVYPFTFPVNAVETGMFPGEEVGEAAGADVFAIKQGVEEAVAKNPKAVREWRLAFMPG